MQIYRLSSFPYLTMSTRASFLLGSAALGSVPPLEMDASREEGRRTGKSTVHNYEDNS